MYRCKNTLEKLTWAVYQINNDTWKSYICATYAIQGGKSYQNYLPPGFYMDRDLDMDDILTIELGLKHTSKLFFDRKGTL